MSAPRSGTEALQKAVIATLKDNATVRALVGARVFDEPPSDKNPKTPYLYLGPLNRRSVENNECSAVKLVTFRIFAVSTEFGRPDVWAVIDAVEMALDGSSLDVEAPWSTAGDTMKFVQDGDVIQPIDPKAAFVDFTTTLQRIGD